jgi:hypothetical protein
MRPLLSQLSRIELVKVCNSIMVAAARDLAEFTQRGIRANDIVTLALQCEELESRLNGTAPPSKPNALLGVEMEIRNTLATICEIGRRIWMEKNNPAKVLDYQIPRNLYEVNPSGSASVA